MKIRLCALALLVLLNTSPASSNDEVIFSNNPMNSWITTQALVTKDFEYYLNPQGLHRNPDSNWYQLGVTKVFKPGRKMLFDFQISGCRKGKGSYRRGDNGDFWLKPTQWIRNGRSPEDQLATVACDIILECEQIVAMGLKKRKAGGKADYAVSRFLKDEVSIDMLNNTCGPASLAL